MRQWKRWGGLMVLAVVLAQWLWDNAPGMASAVARAPMATSEVSGSVTRGAAGPTLPAGAETAQVLGVYFTPPSGAGKELVQWIDQARQEVLVQAYGFTHNAIAQALLRAHARGVKVMVLLDQKSQSTNQYVIDLLQGQKVSLKYDGRHAIAHNKVMVIDHSVVVTGSFNFTNSADSRNAENLLVLRSEGLAERYRSNWQLHWDHSVAAP
jgi:phosphatidylserine/phosphatidylglycerophosphate/cardiolipin synthase-like enzyme